MKYSDAQKTWGTSRPAGADRTTNRGGARNVPPPAETASTNTHETDTRTQQPVINLLEGDETISPLPPLKKGEEKSSGAQRFPVRRPPSRKGGRAQRPNRGKEEQSAAFLHVFSFFLAPHCKCARGSLAVSSIVPRPTGKARARASQTWASLVAPSLRHKEGRPWGANKTCCLYKHTTVCTASRQPARYTHTHFGSEGEQRRGAESRSVANAGARTPTSRALQDQSDASRRQG